MAREDAPVNPVRVEREVTLWVAIALMLASHACLLGWGAAVHSPSLDELGHLPAGLSHWQLARFDLYRVNPPLVRMVAAAPVVFCMPKIRWYSYSESGQTRPEFQFGRQMIAAEGARTFWYFTLSRWACIPFSLLGAYTCFLWARELYGDVAGLLAAALWCFSPGILGNAQMITPDVGAAALAAGSGYTFWRWLKRPSWSRAIIAGGTMGLAELTKTTLGVFFVVWPAIWFFWRVSERGRSSPPAWCFQFLQLATALAIPVYVVNLGYGFEGSFEKLGGIPFTSNALTAKCGQSESSSKTNYFAHKWLGTLRVPFPRNYVLGIDVQWREFEEKDWSYLNGEWRRGGWWFYYIYALVVKEPLGTWALVIMAAAMGIAGRPCRFSWRDEIFLLVPACVVLAIVSLQTGFNHHMRYVLPVLPFVFVWTAKVACSVNRGDARSRASLPRPRRGLWRAVFGSTRTIYPTSMKRWAGRCVGTRTCSGATSIGGKTSFILSCGLRGTRRLGESLWPTPSPDGFSTQETWESTTLCRRRDRKRRPAIGRSPRGRPGRSPAGLLSPSRDCGIETTSTPISYGSSPSRPPDTRFTFTISRRRTRTACVGSFQCR